MKKNAHLQTTEASAHAKRHYTADLFAELLPPVTPALWPNDGTRAAEALQTLLSGPVTQAEYFDTWRLAAYIHELQSEGWAFLKTEVHRPGCRRPIVEYAIDRCDPAVAAALAARGAA